MRIFITTILWTVSFSLSEARETIIQYGHSGVFGTTETTDILTINGVPIAWSGRRNVNSFLSIDNEYETLRMIVESFNQTANKHAYQRRRECRLEGFEPRQVSDRIQYDGAEYLSLDGSADTWTAAVPQALALKQQWDQKAERTEKHKLSLRNGCTELIKAFTRDEHPAAEASFINLMPIFATVAFLGQCVVSIFISKNGHEPPGGGLGSIYYPLRRGGTVDEGGTDYALNGPDSSPLVIPA